MNVSRPGGPSRWLQLESLTQDTSMPVRHHTDLPGAPREDVLEAARSLAPAVGMSELVPTLRSTNDIRLHNAITAVRARTLRLQMRLATCTPASIADTFRWARQAGIASSVVEALALAYAERHPEQRDDIVASVNQCRALDEMALDGGRRLQFFKVDFRREPELLEQAVELQSLSQVHWKRGSDGQVEILPIPPGVVGWVRPGRFTEWSAMADDDPKHVEGVYGGFDEQGQLAAFGVVMSQRHDRKPIGGPDHLTYPDGYNVHYIVVRPDLQGHLLQARLARLCLKAFCESGIEHAISAVSPDNLHSLFSMVNRGGFRIAAIEPHHGGERFVLVKRVADDPGRAGLLKQAAEANTLEHVWVEDPAHCLEHQQALLEQGYQGVLCERTDGDHYRVLYVRSAEVP